MTLMALAMMLKAAFAVVCVGAELNGDVANTVLPKAFA